MSNDDDYDTDDSIHSILHSSRAGLAKQDPHRRRDCITLQQHTTRCSHPPSLRHRTIAFPESLLHTIPPHF
jgi:hypothetical protein